MTDDELAGMAWWLASSIDERRHWMELAKGKGLMSYSRQVSWDAAWAEWKRSKPRASDDEDPEKFPPLAPSSC
ncbi:MAG: hypothetical protein EOP14_06290 [Pseudomonas sp.]|nr:MAG: hypothetical protein EOP14_06290 [Pseudomonas sp.]